MTARCATILALSKGSTDGQCARFDRGRQMGTKVLFPTRSPTRTEVVLDGFDKDRATNCW